MQRNVHVCLYSSFPIKIAYEFLQKCGKSSSYWSLVFIPTHEPKHHCDADEGELNVTKYI